MPWQLCKSLLSSLLLLHEYEWIVGDHVLCVCVCKEVFSDEIVRMDYGPRQNKNDANYLHILIRSRKNTGVVVQKRLSFKSKTRKRKCYGF